MGASSFDPAPRGRTVSRTRCHAPERRKRYVGGEAGPARPMAQSPADAHWTRRAAGLFGVGDGVEGGEPGRGLAVARRAPVAARRERGARAPRPGPAPPPSAGPSSGLISVSRIAPSVALASAPSRPVSATQRITCWISVFGTLALTA